MYIFFSLHSSTSPLRDPSDLSHTQHPSAELNEPVNERSLHLWLIKVQNTKKCADDVVWFMQMLMSCSSNITLDLVSTWSLGLIAWLHHLFKLHVWSQRVSFTTTDIHLKFCLWAQASKHAFPSEFQNIVRAQLPSRARQFIDCFDSWVIFNLPSLPEGRGEEMLPRL